LILIVNTKLLICQCVSSNVYGLLHHPVYREKYAANLKRELPRIPFAPNFWEFVTAGKKLSNLHLNYEQQPEYPLKLMDKADIPLNWRVEKMKFSRDKRQIIYNDSLTLGGIPPETFDYRLGNRSALEWVIDQYRVKVDKRSGIVNDPNRLDDEEYIVRLIKIKETYISARRKLKKHKYFNFIESIK